MLKIMNVKKSGITIMPPNLYKSITLADRKNNFI
jgi:hypothetical protein